MSKMKITCYGPRGSLPTPSRKGFSTLAYGGNTNCYYVEAGPFRIILDNGSGVAVLGNDLMAKGVIGEHFINLISHFHWDHIQGLPFCVPYFIGTNTFHIHGPIPSGHEHTGMPRSAVEEMLSQQQANPHFPVAHECMPATKHYTGHDRQFPETFYYRYLSPNVAENDGVYNQISAACYSQHSKNNIKITTIPLNHPDGCLGYRIDYMGTSMAYCSDNEPLRHPNIQISKLAANVDWILLDGQYTEKQLSSTTQTFGHGTPESCFEQAIACKAKHLVIHHHHTIHDDATLEQMEHAAVDLGGWYDEDNTVPVEFAREGQVWEIVSREIGCNKIISKRP